MTIITGDNSDNVLNGTAESDTIYGASGNDTINGSGGNDILVGGAGFDTIDGGEGTDTVDYSQETGEASVDVNLGTIGGTAYGGTTLWTGLDGFDPYSPTYVGTPGIDPYTSPHPVAVGPALEPYSPFPGSSQASDTYTNIDTLVSIENVITGAGHDSVRGDGAVNRIETGAGDDYLDGGAGADTLIGGSGNDAYLVTQAEGDTIVELADGGEDLIYAVGSSFSLEGYAQIENLHGLTLNATLVGNALANVITGREGAEILRGGGGDDTLLGAYGDDILEGGDGSDTLLGGDGTDTLTGGAGSDNLHGHAGADVFKGTRGGLDGDTIADFGRGDRILFTDVSLAAFTFSLTGNTLTYSGGSLTFGSAPDGTLVASAAAGGGVQITLVRDVDNDFNGDGRSDVLWRHDNGAIFNFLGTASGGVVNNGDNIYTVVANTWDLAATGDFNGDGRDDILWRNDNGAIFNFLGTANGGVQNNGDNSYLQLNAGWTVSGVGDFNGDNRDDILFRDANGVIFNYLGTASGGFVSNTSNLFTDLDDQWQVAGIGDFNGDGRDDLMFRHDDGAIFNVLGTVTGGVENNGYNSFTAIDIGWHVAGIGDFNGDGRDDILWRTDDGVVFNTVSTETGGSQDNYDQSYAISNDGWQVEAIGDYNGDGRDDILWRDDAGAITNWLGTASGAFVDNDDDLFTTVGLEWAIMPADQLV